MTEHQLIARRCTYGTTISGVAPQGVTAPVQYGPRITALILYLYLCLYVGQFLSKKTRRSGAGRVVRYPGL